MGGVDTGEANTITGNTLNGVRIRGDESGDINAHVTVRGNKIFGNVAKGIALDDGANPGIESPVVTGVSETSISGTALANSTVDVYAGTDDEEWRRPSLGDVW